jgi:hypothetical protein
VKNTPTNNFLTNEPIFTRNIPIDSARQAETHRDFKNFSKVVLGEQSGNIRKKSTPLNNFSTVQSIFTNYRTDRFNSTFTSQNSKYYWQKTSPFKASCKDSNKLQDSWTYKTAKIFTRTRHVRP